MKTINKTYNRERPVINKTQKLEEVIKARMKLGTCQRNLHNIYGLEFPTLEKLKNVTFLKQFKSWDEEKQKNFINELGGFANRFKTREYLDNLLKEKLIF